MQIPNLPQMLEMSTCVVPFSILMIELDDDRAFLSDLYFQYRSVMYRAAARYFKNNPAEIEEAFSDTLERLCKYCDHVRTIPQNRLRAYLVKTVDNVCLTRLADIRKEMDHTAFSMDQECAESLPAHEDVVETVLSHCTVEELYQYFDQLSERDQWLIRMRYVHQMSYAEMAQILHLNEGTVRTALSRAKQRLETLILQDKKDDGSMQKT
ncbi:MAG: sigma-70 family RNA polymerase sigma factor [Clostridia bacterium]|nr:sigma-70 family RNA polymerase sigma factor [Clostridia bacterium]